MTEQILALSALTSFRWDEENRLLVHSLTDMTKQLKQEIESMINRASRGVEDAWRRRRRDVFRSCRCLNLSFQPSRNQLTQSLTAVVAVAVAMKNIKKERRDKSAKAKLFANATPIRLLRACVIAF